ncbi:MAG: hypothetical protein HY222_06495 [Thaumarchaeota archaeon]|nr:hypothetical protein [Nitrososphaerota archaeon]MBI3642023.1 hypothetical protein [Nitrososphaerota archaeon]
MFGSTKHCPVCGMDVNKESGIKRFGKYLCSEEHAQRYVEQRAEEEKSMAEERRNSRDRGGGCC